MESETESSFEERRSPEKRGGEAAADLGPESWDAGVSEVETIAIALDALEVVKPNSELGGDENGGSW